MAAQAIGSLYVALGLDSAAFTQGVKRVQTATGRLQAGLEKFGNAATALGKRMSIVSGAMATVGAAAVALVQQTSEAAKEIAAQSKIANASTREFQRWAAGARTVGIQQDKLADILKDVNDRVGDFVETGGGPMKDFFDNVAPKVGVTAEQFKNLSGPQAMQLYVSTLQRAGLNQQQMTFYMEAMASDATALIPILQDGGRAMEGYGDAAEKSGVVMSDTAIKGALEFQVKLQALRDAAQGARNGLAEVLMPVVNKFMDLLIANVIPAMDKVVVAVQSMIEWFGALPGPVQEAAAGVALALGVGGPVLLAIGALSLAMSALIAATGPIGLFIAAAAVLAAAWIRWGDDIKAAVGGAIDWLRTKFDEVVAFFKTLPAVFAQIGRDLIDGLVKGIKERAQAAVDAVREVADAVSQQMDRVTGANKGPISTGAYTGGATGPIPIPSDWGSTNAADGLAAGTSAAGAQGVADAAAYESGWNDRMEINSPSRVMARIGHWLMQGLGNGITANGGTVETSMAAVSDSVVSTTEAANEGFQNFANSAQQSFQSVIAGTASVKDALRSLASQWLSSAASGLFSKGWSGIMGAMGIGANANGTSNWRGGLTHINERGGEIVDLPSGTRIIPHDVSKRMADGSGGLQAVHVTVGVDPETGNLKAFVDQRAGMAAQTMGQAVSSSIPDQIMQFQNDWRRR